MAAPVKKKGLGAPSQRLEAIPPYMFAELERRVEAKRDEGIDVAGSSSARRSPTSTCSASASRSTRWTR
jgi:hypothetical protein